MLSNVPHASSEVHQAQALQMERVGGWNGMNERYKNGEGGDVIVLLKTKLSYHSIVPHSDDTSTPLRSLLSFFGFKWGREASG